MNYWLVKSDPQTYGWEDFKKEGETCWDGVRNYAARRHLKDMRIDDLCFFYESQVRPPRILGVAKVVKEAYQDPTTSDNRWVAVDIKKVKELEKPITILDIRNDKRLQEMVLLRISRLSVQPVTQVEYDAIIDLASK